MLFARRNKSMYISRFNFNIDPPHLPMVLFPPFNASLRTFSPHKEMPPLTIFFLATYRELDDPWPLARPSKASCPRACPTILICPSDFDSLSGGRKAEGQEEGPLGFQFRHEESLPSTLRDSIEMRDKREPPRVHSKLKDAQDQYL